MGEEKRTAARAIGRMKAGPFCQTRTPLTGEGMKRVQETADARAPHLPTGTGDEATTIARGKDAG